MRYLLPLLATAPLLLVSCNGTENDVAMQSNGKTYVEGEEGNRFSKPDIRNDFCGVHINYQYCKCAFHDEYCDSIGLNKNAANSHVQNAFGEYVDELHDAFVSICAGQNGYIKKDTCYTCPAGTTVEDTRCAVTPVEESNTAADASATAEENDPDCSSIAQNWEKYSDIDFRIPQNERSYEAKQYAETQDALVQTYAEQAELVYETELLRAQLDDIREYKAALVDNLRDNLVKATLRLTYTTYSQVNGAKGAGESFSKFLTSAESIEALGAGMKTVQSMIPADSRLAIDTNTAEGKMRSIGWNATLEAIESMGNPSAIAQQVVKDAKAAVAPSADITPEEVEILRKQNLENNLLDSVIAELEAEIADNERWLGVADQHIADLEAEAQQWKEDERERVLLLLEEECRADD